MTARPVTARPSISRRLPSLPSTDMVKASPRDFSFSTDCSRRCASGEGNHCVKPRIRRGAPTPITRPVSPSISGSPETLPQATTICLSPALNVSALCTLASRAWTSDSCFESRFAHFWRPRICRRAVVVVRMIIPARSRLRGVVMLRMIGAPLSRVRMESRRPRSFARAGVEARATEDSKPNPVRIAAQGHPHFFFLAFVAMLALKSHSSRPKPLVSEPNHFDTTVAMSR
jgi:hypothetical protein